MSGHDFEMSIYLYAEISDAEKKQLAAHLKTFANCASLFAEVAHLQQYVEQAAREPVLPPNAGRLTGRTMVAIAATKPTQRLSFIDPFFGRVKVALTVISLVLLISFAVEFANDGSKPASITNAVGGTVVLNATLFRQAFTNRKAKHEWFAECRSPFKPDQYDLDCLKSKLK